MKRAGLALVLCIAVIAACAKKEPPPVVTDSAYFNEKMNSLATELKNNSSRRVTRAAVMNFVNAGGGVSQLGKYLTTKFSALSVQNNLFQLPAGGQVEQKLRDIGLQPAASLKAEDARRLGEELNVDAIIVGVISDLQKGSDVDLLVQMIEARSGNIISAASTNILRSKPVSTMMSTFE